MKPIVRIAICQDGRAPGLRSDLKHEAGYFETMYGGWKYLNRPDIEVQCYAFSSFGGVLLGVFLYGFFPARTRPPAPTRRPLVPPARPAAPTLTISYGSI